LWGDPIACVDVCNASNPWIAGSSETNHPDPLQRDSSLALHLGFSALPQFPFVA